MYKSLNAESLGISGRPNELIELALTYKFRGLDLNAETWSRGREQAAMFLKSANIRVGGFDLPVRLSAEEAEYKQDLAALNDVAEITSSLDCTNCTAVIAPYCEHRAYHEDFEFHRERLTEVAEQLKPFGIRLGLGFRAPIASRAAYETQFISSYQTLMALVQTVVSDNVGVCLDVWHWHVSGASLEEIKGIGVDLITSVRLADAPADLSMDSITESQRLVPGSTGVVPNAGVLKWLNEMDYSGPVSAYCHGDQFTSTNRNKTVAEIAETLDALMNPTEEEASEDLAVEEAVAS